MLPMEVEVEVEVDGVGVEVRAGLPQLQIARVSLGNARTRMGDQSDKIALSATASQDSILY